MHERHIIICIDLYSHIPEIKLWGDVTSRFVIEFLKALFSRYCLVNEIVSDNGALFVSHEFGFFLHMNDIRRSRTALYHPQSNPVKRFNRMLKEGVKAQLYENVLCKDAVNQVLANYRSTVNCTSGCTPAVLMLSREMTMSLNVLLPVVVENTKHNDELLHKAQKRMHCYYRRHRCKKSVI